MKKVKALALFSGGLDSILAIKLILKQGVDVVAINFANPFSSHAKDDCGVAETAKQLGVHLKVVNLGDEYLKMVQNTP